MYFKNLPLFLLLLLVSCHQESPQQIDSPLVLDQELINNVKTSKTVLVKDGEGIFPVLERSGVSPKQALKIINNFRDEIEFSKIKPGNEFRLFYTKDLLTRVEFQSEAFEYHVLDYINNKWNYELKAKKVDIDYKLVEGSIDRSSTLDSSLRNQNISPSAANEVINVLKCKINFRVHARVGDRYKILFKLKKLEQKIIAQKPIYISYFGKVAGTHESYYFNDTEDNTYSAHYTEDGQALIQSGLRYPLKKMHIRSHFGHRIHPVTGKKSFHRGVDLRGRHGEPVYSVAEGRVISITNNKYAGKTIGLKHNDGSKSFYYHLSKRFVQKGQWVKKRQRIGRVGSTGRVTGAHLHFGFKNSKGKWINPMTKRMIATPKLSGERMLKLKNQISLVEGRLELMNNHLVNNSLLTNPNI